jgi:hypothetical protein
MRLFSITAVVEAADDADAEAVARRARPAIGRLSVDR